MYDVAIVGARCAGASLAMLLARRGWRVALVDRATFPSDTISTHFLWQRGAARLAAWGLLSRLQRLGCAPLSELTFDFGRVAITGRPPEVAGVSDCYCPRRTILDKLLVDAAVESGAEIFERTSVKAVHWSGDRACGLDVAPAGGTRKRLDARVVVGADGRHSIVAAQVGATATQWIPPLTFVYYSYWSGLSERPPAYFMRSGRLILRWPTNDGLTCVYVGSPSADFTSFRRDIEGNFLRALGWVEGLREEVAEGRREERYRGTADLPNFYRAAWGPGWALVGDAGHHKDPATGFGMTDAFTSADALADALQRFLTGEQPSDAALADYQRWRDAETSAGWDLTLKAASLLPVSPRTESRLADAAGRSAEVTRIIGALGGAIPVGDVFPALDLST
jgi:2-polyprenyl-6-methoxyphenol hydroxylase-like FAD-dependent oxidoreductase